MNVHVTSRLDTLDVYGMDTTYGLREYWHCACWGVSGAGKIFVIYMVFVTSVNSLKHEERHMRKERQIE
jgi:hypothetical protein